MDLTLDLHHYLPKEEKIILKSAKKQTTFKMFTCKTKSFSVTQINIQLLCAIDPYGPLKLLEYVHIGICIPFKVKMWKAGMRKNM